MLRTTLIALILTAALLAGCGDDDSASTADGDAATKPATATKQEAAMKPAPPPPATGKVVKVVGSDYGRVIADGKGEAFYLFDRERAGKPECYGECAAVWPPVLTKGEPRAGKGVTAAKLGTARRRDGRRQVTYAGRPLYHYVDDAPGTILCQSVDEFGGLWLVVSPSGQAVR